MSKHGKFVAGRDNVLVDPNTRPGPDGGVYQRHLVVDAKGIKRYFAKADAADKRFILRAVKNSSSDLTIGYTGALLHCLVVLRNANGHEIIRADAQWGKGMTTNQMRELVGLPPVKVRPRAIFLTMKSVDLWKKRNGGKVGKIVINGEECQTRWYVSGVGFDSPYTLPEIKKQYEEHRAKVEAAERAKVTKRKPLKKGR